MLVGGTAEVQVRDPCTPTIKNVGQHECLSVVTTSSDGNDRLRVARVSGGHVTFIAVVNSVQLLLILSTIYVRRP